MPDLFANFAFAQLVTPCAGTGTDTTLNVDDVSSFPSSAQLALADMYLVLEGNLTHPNSFEIVKLTGVDTGARTLTVVRAQDGTAGVAHASSTWVKAAVTAGMLNRLQPARTVATATTASLAPNVMDTTTTMPLARGYRLYSISTDRPARVRLYETAAARAGDVGRRVGVDPASSAGVVLDYVTTVGASAYLLSPLVEGASLEAVPSPAIPMIVTNLDTTAASVTVQLVYVRTEG